MTNRYDLTKGPILNRLLLVALPIMGTQLLQMLYNLTDMFWLGRVGEGAVAASGTAGMYLWMSMAFIMVGRMGAEIGVSQHLGKGDEAGARKYAQNALMLAILLGVAFSAVLLLGRRPLIGFFAIQDAGVAAQAEQYLAITALSCAGTFITGAITGSFNAAGNARTPFVINAVGLVLNMALDPVFIFSLGWGIGGAALATMLAQNAVALMFLLAIKKGKKRPFAEFRLLSRLDRAHAGQIFRWTIPIALENLLFTLLSMVISRIVASFGTQAMAVQRVGSQVESLTWLIGGGFASAVTAFIGQNYGAQKWGRIQRGFSIAFCSMAVWGTLSTLLLFFGGGALFGLFLPDPATRAAGADFLRILAVCQVVACLEYTSSGAFRGLGQTLPPSIASIGGNLLRLPFIYLLSRTALGLNGVWWGLSIGAMVRGAWLFLWFLWYRRRLPKSEG